MDIERSRLHEAAQKAGVDLVGVAPVSRFDGVPPEGHPNSINPFAKSVIVLGFMIPRGALRGIEEQTAWQTMGCGDPVNPLILVESTYNVVRWLEDQGWEANPIYKHPLELRSQGVPVAKDKPGPDVLLNFDYAAYAAGLGTMGRGKFFLTPQFGSRQVFSIVLTDADISPDPLFEGDFCGDCGACAAACPVRALSGDETSAMRACGRELRWRRLHTESCVVCKTGATENPYLKNAEPWRVGAACGRACVARLDREKLLSLQYVNPFRAE